MRSPAAVVAPTIAAETVTARTRSQALAGEKPTVVGMGSAQPTADDVEEPRLVTGGELDEPRACHLGHRALAAVSFAVIVVERRLVGRIERSALEVDEHRGARGEGAVDGGDQGRGRAPSSWPERTWMITPDRSARTVIAGSSRRIGSSGGVSS